MDKRPYIGKRRIQVLEASRRYRQRHPEKISEFRKSWRSRNTNYEKLYRQRNGDKLRAQDRERSQTEVYKKHKAAQQRVHRAIRSSKIIKPSVCSECGQSKESIHGHHPDYAKPLAVIWVCQECHVGIHVKLRGNTA